MSTSKCAFICYNSTVTGSKSIRALNNSDYIQEKLYDRNNQNMLKYYCKQYDESEKKNEPFYDLIAGMMTHLKPDEFNKYFEYIPVNLTKTGTNFNGFHPNHENNVIFKMESTRFNEKDKWCKNDLYKYYDYVDKKTTHIFIYGPITDSIYDDLLIEIKTNQNNLIIHLQGENILDNKGNNGDTVFGLESKGNLFSNAFNYQNNMKNASKLRDLIQDNESCQAFTIKCKIDSDLCVDNIEGEELLWPLNEDGKRIKNGLPKIYIKFYEHIKSLLDGNFSDYSDYDKINNKYIYQDMVDKDNMISIVFLVLNSICEPVVSLIGREAFKLTYANVGIHNYQSLHLPNVPYWAKPECIEEIELNFGKTMETYWPAFKNELYDLEYDKEMTLCHYYLMVNCFKICINDLLKRYGFQNICFVYNEGLIPNPSCNETHTPLLNEILFFPSLNTYIMCINQFSDILESFHIELGEIINKTKYKSDLDLKIIIKSWLNKFEK